MLSVPEAQEIVGRGRLINVGAMLVRQKRDWSPLIPFSPEQLLGNRSSFLLWIPPGLGACQKAGISSAALQEAPKLREMDRCPWT